MAGDSHWTNDVSSPGYVELTASTTRKSKEKLRVDSLIPSEILENSEGIKNLLEAYYTFMNLDEFIYAENESFEDVVLDGKAVFRISDPKNENDEFFTDETGADSTLQITTVSGSIVNIPLSDINVNISNGNELPGSLANLTSEIGKTFQVNGLDSYNGGTARLTTPVKHWVGPGPSHVMNNIERAMDIDSNTQKYLELMQKEIASVIPRDITVNKRNLYKNIIDYYKVRGSADSIEIFFRLLFNDEVEVQYPWDKTLIPSSGNWDVNPALPKGGQYLDNKGQLSNVIRLQDSLRYQKFSYLIRTGQNVSTWENVCNRLVHPAGFKFFGEILMIIELSKAILGEDTTEGDTLIRKVLSAMPDRQPGAIGLEDIPLLVEMFASVFLPSIQGKIHKHGAIALSINNGVITTVNITNPGSGYLTSPTISSTDLGVPAGHTPATFTTTLLNGGIGDITITDGGKDFQSPSVTAAAPPPIIFDGSNAPIVDVTNDTILLTTEQQEALPAGSQVTYDSGGGTSIGGLVSGNQYYVLSSATGLITLSATSGGSIINITSVGSGPTHSFTGTTATFTASKTDGQIGGVEIRDAGFGYTSAPTITVNGQPTSGNTLTTATITIGIDSKGRLEIDTVNITNPGANYAAAFGNVAANPNAGSLASIEIAGGADKNYRTAPSIIISEPTATDADGVLLSSNVQATAVFTLDSNNEINGSTITNAGSGYTADPILRIDSNANNEIRGKDLRPILILYLNHLLDRSRTQPDNNYFNLKGNTYLDSTKKFDFNERIEVFGDVQIQSTDTTNINKYNVNSFIHTN